METQEIYNLSIPELVTTSFSIDWSADNQVSLITPRGIHVLELQPNPLCSNPTAKFKRSFMYASNYLPCEPFISITDNLINNFDREDLYLAMLDGALTPKLSDKDDIISRIVALAWSPVKLLKPSKCLLATVTSAGAIDLILKLGKDWISICNLSALWWNIVNIELNLNPKNINIDTVDAATFRNNIRKLQGTAVTWSQLYEADSSTPFSYLVTAYRNCDLVIWKIERVSEFPTNIKPQLINRTHFDIDVKITKLHWISLDMKKYLILIGFLDGRIFCVNENVSKKCIIDIVDKIPISYMDEFSRTDSEINVIVAKSFFLIIITINYEGVLLRQRHIQLPGFSITGLLCMSKNDMLVTTQDAKMYLVKFNDKSQLIYESVKCDIKTSKVQFLGIVQSPSRATFINVTSPSGLYDHLMNREPSTLQIFGFKGETWNPWNILNSIDSTEIYWDCFETIRIRASKETDPENYLPNIPETFEALSINQLRNVMWLTLITGILKQKKTVKKIDNVVGEISEAQPLIFIHSASSHMIQLSTKKILTDEMRLSIYFLRIYLEVFLAGKEDDVNNKNNISVKHAKDALNATKHLNLIEVESCNLCGKAVTELPWNTPRCPDGHRLPRCALTLLQVTCLKFRSCPVCNRIFHPSLDEDYEDVKCLYCGVSGIYDNRIIGINDELEKKYQNLSIRPTWDIQGGKSQESETSAVNEKRNKKRRTTVGDTFTLVVNKENEITETWQEL